MRIDEKHVALIREAADTLDLEEVRYTQRFGGDCPNGPTDSDGQPATLEDGSVISHGDTDCELCGGTGTVEDEDAPWMNPMIEGLRELAADLEKYVPEPRVLPAYTGDDARCAKCGNTGTNADERIHTHFGYSPRPDQLRPAGVFVVFGENGPSASAGPPAALPAWLEGTIPEQEFLARACGRCGFMWIEAPLDDPNLALQGLAE